MNNETDSKKKPAPTIWRVPDDLWAEIEPLLPKPGPKKKPGRPRVPDRVALNGILYVLRTGCQWKAVPKEFSSGSTCHLRFSQWVKAGVFAKLWAILVERYDELKGIDWQWQALDSATVKAPLGGEETGPNPTDRGKSGSKRHLITEGGGIPIGTTLSGANRHDMKKAADTVDAIVVERPDPEEQDQHLCTDKGYDYPETREEMAERGYQVHIPQRGLDTPIPEPDDPNRHPARRWVVERTHSWFNRFRKLLIRWEKKAEHWLGLIQFAACLIVYRRAFLG